MKIKFALIFFLLSSVLFAQESPSKYEKEIYKFQSKLNSEFKDAKTSPLTEEDLESFEKLDFFKIDTNFRVVAKLSFPKDSKPFKMKTNTDRLPIYKLFAVASFKLNGKPYKLNIYQNQKLMLTDDYKDYLFLPFTDLTNGKSTYGGGRYIDLEIPEGDTMVIDFNKAYNPFCAYNDKFSCPIPPKENHLNVEIKAGVKNFKDHD